MRKSYRLKVRAIHQDAGGAAGILLSGAGRGTGSSLVALLIVTNDLGVPPIVPLLGEKYVIDFSPDPQQENTKVRC